VKEMKFAQFCQNIWSWIVDKFSWLRGTIGTGISNLWVRLSDFQIFNKIGGAFIFVKDKVSTLIAPLLAKLSELGILGVIVKYAGPVLSIVTLIPLIKQIIDGIKARKATKPTTVTEAANLGDEKVKKSLGKKFAKTAFANKDDFAKNAKDSRKRHAETVKEAKKDLEETKMSEGFNRMFRDIKETSKDIIMEAAASTFGQFLIANYDMTAEEAAKHVLWREYEKVKAEKKRAKILSALGFDPAERAEEEEADDVEVKVKASKKAKNEAEKDTKAKKSSKKETSKKKSDKKKKKKTILDEFEDDDRAFFAAIKNATDDQMEKLEYLFGEYDVRGMFVKIAQGINLNNVERSIVESVATRYLAFSDELKERAIERGLYPAM